MRIDTTDGNVYYIPEGCPYCELDTAGNHKPDCPNKGVEYCHIQE